MSCVWKSCELAFRRNVCIKLWCVPNSAVSRQMYQRTKSAMLSLSSTFMRYVVMLSHQTKSVVEKIKVGAPDTVLQLLSLFSEVWIFWTGLQDVLWCLEFKTAGTFTGVWYFEGTEVVEKWWILQCKILLSQAHNVLKLDMSAIPSCVIKNEEVCYTKVCCLKHMCVLSCMKPAIPSSVVSQTNNILAF